MQTTIDEHGQLECDALWNPQPMKLAQQWRHVVVFPRRENQSGGGIQYGLQTIERRGGKSGERCTTVVQVCEHES